MYINKENLIRDLEENYKLGQLFLKKEKDLTEDEKTVLRKEIEKSENEEYLSEEEFWKDIYEHIKELENEKIQIKI